MKSQGSWPMLPAVLRIKLISAITVIRRSLYFKPIQLWSETMLIGITYDIPTSHTLTRLIKSMYSYLILLS